MRVIIDRLVRNDRGVALATVYFMSVMALAAALLFSFQALATNRASVWTLKSDQVKSQADAGVQLGIARLSRVLAALEETSQLDGITESRMREYDQAEPGAFWTDHAVTWKAGTPQAGMPLRLADETPFELSSDKLSASFTINTPEHAVKVKLVYANAMPKIDRPVGRATLTTGYNDVRLRYRYEIDSESQVKMADGRAVARVTRVRSYAENPVDAENTVQVRLSRSLTRYNLFVENNTTPSGTPIYSSVNYKGKVYSVNKMYLTDDPTFNATVELVQPTDALAWQYKSDPSIVPPKTFKFVNSKGDPLIKGKELVLGASLIPWPDYVEEDLQRRIAQYGTPQPAGPAQVLTPGVYPAPADIVPQTSGGNGLLRRAIYVNGDAEVTLKAIDGKTHYIVKPAVGALYTEVQEVALWENPEFLIFVDGRLKIEGQVADRTKFTAASTGDLIVTNDLVYEGGIPNDDTVVGLLSWKGHVLVAKDVGQNSIAVKYPRNLYIHAVIMAPNGGFGAEGFDTLVSYALKSDESAYRGKIFHVGSQIRRYSLPTQDSAKITDPVGTPCRDTPCGWGLATEFDTDLESTKAPPYFPANGPYTLQDRKKLRVVDIFRVL